MADFAPTKIKGDASKAKGSLAVDNTEHQSPPRLYLEHHHLEKLGMKKMPAVGSKIKISGTAHVGATSENQDSDASPGGKMRRSMTLHLHQMDVGDGKQVGTSDEDQKAGMKSEIDKALAKGAGSESGKAKAAGGKKGSTSSGG